MRFSKCTPVLKLALFQLHHRSGLSFVQQMHKKTVLQLRLMARQFTATVAEGPLDGFETYGWEPLPTKSADENLMDLTLLVTRGQAKQLKQGSMACLLVRENDPDKSPQSLVKSIVCAANNMPFYSENGSDIHAEIYAIGKSVRRGIVLDKCTAYITMPPCKRCFPALYSAGIQRIVSNKKADISICEAAKKHGIVMDVVASDRNRVDELVRAHAVSNSCTTEQMTKKKQKTTE